MTAIAAEIISEGGGDISKMQLPLTITRRMKDKIISEDYENLKKLIKRKVENNDGCIKVCFDGKFIVDFIKEHNSKAVDRICVLVRQRINIDRSAVSSFSPLSKFNTTNIAKW